MIQTELRQSQQNQTVDLCVEYKQVWVVEMAVDKPSFGLNIS